MDICGNGFAKLLQVSITISHVPVLFDKVSIGFQSITNGIAHNESAKWVVLLR
jgi:hypothetical protein